MRGMYPCPCCGYKTVSSPDGGTFEICPVCNWEDCHLQRDDPDYDGGPNGISLREAQQNFLTYGPPPRRFKNGVDPRTNYEPDAHWKPL
jgi:hypothetical protein